MFGANTKHRRTMEMNNLKHAPTVVEESVNFPRVIEDMGFDTPWALMSPDRLLESVHPTVFYAMTHAIMSHCNPHQDARSTLPLPGTVASHGLYTELFNAFVCVFDAVQCWDEERMKKEVESRNWVFTITETIVSIIEDRLEVA